MPLWFAEWLKKLDATYRADLYTWFNDCDTAVDDTVSALEPDEDDEEFDDD